MSTPSGKLHYTAQYDPARTLCGRIISGSLRVTGNPYAVTCIRCKCHRHLDGSLGNMVHTGL
jgi:hypothetical protein